MGANIVSGYAFQLTPIFQGTHIRNVGMVFVSENLVAGFIYLSQKGKGDLLVKSRAPYYMSQKPTVLNHS